jgi:peroxiredoxin-like protein
MEGFMEHTHTYLVNTHWIGKKTGTVSPADAPAPMFFDAPPEFGGEGGHWTPEHMLVAAVASCYVATFSAIAAMSKLEFIGLEVAVEGVLTKEADGLRFTRIVVRPELALPEGANEERALRVLEKAEKGCLIARSLAAKTELLPQITVRELLPA